jgi:teichuronic acid biosynthesis glycosyltransferase TuaG|tara:strand:- start:698 stop:1438 length:741 start_codon:yes stop_codon:yes gene_type:complete
MPLVSIIMPYYKKEPYIEDTIKSILNQSHTNFEILLINDDIENKNFIRIISNLDSRIRLIHNDKNLGAGPSRNKAIKLSKGEYIAFCDCDDLWKQNKLELQLNFMEQFKLNFSFTSYDIIDENSVFLKTRKAPDYLNFKKLRNSCDIGLSTVITKKNIFENNKYQFANLKTKEDYVLWIRLALDGVKMRGFGQSLASWRKNKNSLSSSIIQKLIDGYKVYRIYLGYGVIKSLFCLTVLSINFILKN